MPHAALALDGSQSRAATLLRDALGLGGLPGALEAVVQQLAALPLRRG